MVEVLLIHREVVPYGVTVKAHSLKRWSGYSACPAYRLLCRTQKQIACRARTAVKRLVLKTCNGFLCSCYPCFYFLLCPLQGHALLNTNMSSDAMR